MITSAPPLDADEKQQRKIAKEASSSSSADEPRHQSVQQRPLSSSLSSPSSSKQRNYPSGKNLAGGGRMRATARALVRGLTVVKMKRDSRGRAGYEAV